MYMLEKTEVIVSSSLMDTITSVFSNVYFGLDDTITSDFPKVYLRLDDTITSVFSNVDIGLHFRENWSDSVIKS
jgi:hypothetical protein